MLSKIYAVVARNIRFAATAPCRRSHGDVFRDFCRRPASDYSQMHRLRTDAEQVGRKFEVSDDELTEVTRRMSGAMELGVRRSRWLASGSSAMGCWDTRVPYPWPSAAPVHRFLSADLSRGDRFRTELTTTLRRLDASWTVSNVHPLTADDLRTGNVAADLFGRVAGELAALAETRGLGRAGLPLALTLGFPVEHGGPLGGPASLLRWTKELGGGRADGARGVVDVAAEWRKAAARAGVAAGPVVVLNDACVAMMKGPPSARVAIVVDDGCNCCYVSEFGRNVVNTEWGAFGEDGTLDHLLTEYDRRLDARSRDPGKQIYEKMTSGMYMAELVRDMVLTMASNGVLFGGVTTKAMITEYALQAKHLWLVESDGRFLEPRGGNDDDAARIVLTDVLDVFGPSDMDCELFRYACRCVTTRSANLIAAGLSAVLERTGLPVHVVLSGSAFKTHSSYALAVGAKARRLTAQQKPFTLLTADDSVDVTRILAGVLATIAEKPT
ncbi:hexokinase-4-like [Aphis gossypii]|uniref:hexokinase-4-like n=1 Tax=Aphis gossypii TaxID=80765 RepID=UPI0021592B8F|nr:hexokinase-4-like [Aphis gossypii]